MVEYHSPHTIAGTIRLLRGAFPGSILVVEGPTDARVYESLVSQDHCQVICAHTKANVIGAIEILLQAQVMGVLGIVDADFSHLEDDFPRTAGLFRTDTHDLETMIVLSPALDRVLAEYGSPQKLTDFERRSGTVVRDALLLAVLPVGYLRWLSIRLQLNLRFSELDFRRFLPDRAPLRPSIRHLVTTAKNHSQRHDLDTKYLVAEIERIASERHDPAQVCCGHDIVVALSVALRRLLGTNDPSRVSPERLEQSLRLAFRPDFFRATVLYTSVVAWEADTRFAVFGLDPHGPAPVAA